MRNGLFSIAESQENVGLVKLRAKKPLTGFGGFTVSQMDSYFKKAPNKTRGPLMELLSRLCKGFTFNIVLEVLKVLKYFCLVL